MNRTFAILALTLLLFARIEAQENITIGGFCLEVPKGLSSLTKAEREQKYTIQGQIPDEVYQTENDDTNISFMATFVPIEESKFPSLQSNLEKQFTNSNSEILKSDIIELDGKKFILTQVMLKIHNVLMTNLVTESRGKMVMLIISNSVDRDDYLDENNQIMNSLRLSNSFN